MSANMGKLAKYYMYFHATKLGKYFIHIESKIYAV